MAQRIYHYKTTDNSRITHCYGIKKIRNTFLDVYKIFILNKFLLRPLNGKYQTYQVILQTINNNVSGIISQ